MTPLDVANVMGSDESAELLKEAMVYTLYNYLKLGPCTVYMVDNTYNDLILVTLLSDRTIILYMYIIYRTHHIKGMMSPSCYIYIYIMYIYSMMMMYINIKLCVRITSPALKLMNELAA